jgi:hypothetical protein
MARRRSSPKSRRASSTAVLPEQSQIGLSIASALLVLLPVKDFLTGIGIDPIWAFLVALIATVWTIDLIYQILD